MESSAQTYRERIRLVIMRIAATIARELNPQKIVLFGSHAYGEPPKGSDIDLLIVMETSEPFHKRWARVYRWSENREKESFSPFVFTPKELEERLEAGDPFLQEIERRGKVLYAR